MGHAAVRWKSGRGLDSIGVPSQGAARLCQLQSAKAVFANPRDGDPTALGDQGQAKIDFRDRPTLLAFTTEATTANISPDALVLPMEEVPAANYTTGRAMNPGTLNR